MNSYYMMLDVRDNIGRGFKFDKLEGQNNVQSKTNEQTLPNHQMTEIVAPKMGAGGL
jgi:hypothetical protein